MEKLTSNMILPFYKRIYRYIPIRLITNNWVSNMGQMNTNLVGSTRFYLTLNERICIRHCEEIFLSLRKIDVAIQVSVFWIASFIAMTRKPSTLYQLIMSHCTLSSSINSNFCFIFCILDSEDFVTNCSCRWRWHSRYNSMIDFFHLMILEFIQEKFERIFFLGYKDTSTRITIDSMDEGWTKCEAIMSIPEIILDLFNKRTFCGFMIPRMNIDSGRFIYHEEIFIFIENNWALRFLAYWLILNLLRVTSCFLFETF